MCAARAAAGTVHLDYVSTSAGVVTAQEGPVTYARGDRLAPGVTPPGVRAAVMGGYKRKDGEGFRCGGCVWEGGGRGEVASAGGGDGRVQAQGWRGLQVRVGGPACRCAGPYI